MSQRVRLVGLIATLALWMGFAVVTDRLWAHQSWRQVIGLCVVIVVSVTLAAVRHHRRKGRGLVPPR